jgi:phage-related protein
MKPLHWIGSSRRDLLALPYAVQADFGYALYEAQMGGKHPNAKPLKGFKGASVLEIVESHDGEAYRAVYTVKLADAVYVLHVFQKKSKRGIATPKAELDIIVQRLKVAIDDAQGGQP